jgi:PncC family amidohydrolase
MSPYTKQIECLRALLVKNNLKISTAESCTGGLISSLLTDIEGASEFFEQGFVTYSPAAKIKLLGVNPATISTYGVISEQVAHEMALGLPKTGAGISTTGLLGPADDGVSPVGTVFIGLLAGEKIKVVKYHSKLSTRVEIKQDIAQKALELVCEFLDESSVSVV